MSWSCGIFASIPECKLPISRLWQLVVYTLVSWSSSLYVHEVTSPSPVKGFEDQDKDLHNDSHLSAVIENK